MIPVFLVGFMATGKSTVGRQVAALLGRRFVDVDDAIAAKGEPVAALVARDEAEFRRREAAALAELISDDIVIATGGGAAAYGDNLDRMRAAGVVIALTASIDTIIARAAGGPERPLLGDRSRATALLGQRMPAYRRAHAGIATDDASLDEVCARVIHVIRAAERLPASVRRDAALLGLGERTYPIAVVDDLATAASLIREHLPARKLAIITDGNVAPHWADKLRDGLGDRDVLVEVIAPGEHSKQLSVYQGVCERLVAAGLDRSSAIVALGGGVVGDLAGFIAATLFRGIDVVQIPTTLVAMTDSAIGGKTGVDLAAGKNLVGAFWQPRAVIAPLEVLATLPIRERRAAFGELWKYAILDGEGLWSAVAALAPWARGDTLEAAIEAPGLADVVRRCAALKAWIVGRDERERSGERALLNLGHTVGHAIESAAGFELLHGECVGLGLIAAARLGTGLGLTAPSLEVRITDAVAASGLDTGLDPWLRDDVLAWISVDKKRAGTKVGFVAPREVGVCEVVPVEVSELRRILRRTSPA